MGPGTMIHSHTCMMQSFELFGGENSNVVITCDPKKKLDGLKKKVFRLKIILFQNV